MQVDHGLKGKNNETEEAMPTKINLMHMHTLYLINLYFHKFLELIPFFDPHGLYSPWKFWKKTKTKDAFPDIFANNPFEQEKGMARRHSVIGII